MSEWIRVEDKLPPACHFVLVYRGKRHYVDRFAVEYISTRPRECVEDELISHWMPLPAPPATGAQP